MPPEALKSDLEATTRMPHVLYKTIKEEEKVSTEWEEGSLSKISKKVDHSKYENYRGTTLLSASGKFFKVVLSNWMKH